MRQRHGSARPFEPPDPYELGLRLLGVRAHSEAELRRKLARRGCEAEAIDGTLDRLRERGYVDDGSFAHQLAERRLRDRGPVLIAAELASKGIGREDVATALVGVDRSQLLAAARRQARQVPGLDRIRVAGRLQRRGYPMDVIREALAGPCEGS